MLKHALISVSVAVALTGCTMAGKKQNDIASAQQDAAVATIQKNKLNEGIEQSVYNENDSYVVLGEPFKFKAKQDLPEIFLTPTKFRSYRSKTLGETVDYLNTKFGPYGVYISFSSDAIEYLNGTGGDKKDSGLVGTDDSTRTSFDISSVYTDKGAGSLLDDSNVTISLNHDKHIALKQVLDGIAAKTNLWWKYGKDSRVTFYRTDTKLFPINQYAEETKLTSSIKSSTGGGESSGGTNSSTASNHTYNLNRDLGKPMEQLLAGIKSTASEGARIEVLPALSMVAVTDTPAKLDVIESFIDQANATAGKMIQLNIELWELITTDDSNYGIEQAIKYTNGNTTIGFDGIAVGDTGSLGKFGITITGGSLKGTEMALRALQGTKSLSLKKSITTTVPNNEVVPVQYVNEKKYADNIETSISGDTVTQSASTDTTTNGIVFFATPRVNSDGTIAVRVVTDVSSLNSLDPLEVGDSQLQLTDRTVSSMVSARNVRPGTSILMTGFEQTIDNSQNHSLFGDWSWFAGGNDTKKTQRSVMLIIVTPHIEKV